MSHLATRAAACLALLCPLTALAGQPVNVEIYDRTAGQVLPVYWHDGERFVAGEPGHEYEIRIRNREHSRVLAVTSVDGVNVITGRTAAPDQGGYVLDPRGRLEIDGWRKNMAEVAAFYFTSLPDSYAARTGRPDNVGRHRRRPVPGTGRLSRDSGAGLGGSGGGRATPGAVPAGIAQCPGGGGAGASGIRPAACSESCTATSGSAPGTASGAIPGRPTRISSGPATSRMP